MVTAQKIKSYILVLTLLLSGWAAADLVDDFESYAIGEVLTVASPPWTSSETASYGSIASDGGNQYITVWASSDYRDLRRPLAPDAPAVDNTGIATLFLRVYVTVASPIDNAFGLTHNDAMNWYDQYGPYFRLIGSSGPAGTVELSVRNGGGFVDDLAYLNIGQWYNFWLVINCANASGTFDLYYAEDGETATLARAANGFRFAYAEALDNFVLMTAGGDAGVANVRVDDVYLLPGEDLSYPVIPLRAHNPTPTSGATGVLTTATLSWYTGMDPNNPTVPNPNITKHYVYMREGDPNLTYVAPVEVSSGYPTVNPTAGCTPPVTLLLDKTYYWRVDESVNNSGPADPNTIKGSVWSFETQKSTPIIAQQPADARAFATDPNALFTVTFSSINPVTATWKKNDIDITPDGVNVKVSTGSTSSTLEIVTPELSDEGKYYCVLSVDPGTTTDDAQTATRLLIIKKELAKFEFEESLDDTSGNSAPSGIVKTVSLTDPNELLATVVPSPSYVTGIQGKAISLNGTQYIDFGTGGYPKAGPLDTLGDVRGPGYEKSGFGRGMEQGSILCWVQPASSGVIYSNANAPADDTHFALTTNGTTNARIIIRGENFDGSAQNLGEANGAYLMQSFDLKDGQWHLFAATWNDSTARIYLNGEQVATNTQGFTEVYKPWERSNLMGTSRTLPNRWMLNTADFVTGAIDSLRVYNYVISADAIAQEYKTLRGITPCANHNFTGNAYNFDNTVSSYCKIDVADLLILLTEWLDCGLYPDCP